MLYAKVMAILRAAFSLTEGRDGCLDDERHGRPSREREERAITIMKNIALGSALIHGRDYVDDFDINQIRHIAFSSMPEQRRILFQALIETGGQGNTKRMMELTGFSRKTALHYMKELGHLGICAFNEGNNLEGCSISLKEEFIELVETDIDENERSFLEFIGDAPKRASPD